MWNSADTDVGVDIRKDNSFPVWFRAAEILSQRPQTRLQHMNILEISP